MKKVKLISFSLVLFIMVAVHCYFLHRIMLKHRIHDFYFLVYFVIYVVFSLSLLMVFDVFCKMKPMWTLFWGGICGWFLSFFSLFITDVIFSGEWVFRWRILFVMSGGLLIGWCYFPFFIFLLKHIKSMKRKV